MDLRLSVENIAALETRTEGWIVGLQLAALSLQDREDSTEFIQSFTGSHHHILDYLVEEVLTKQSSDTQSFLLQTSILERLTGSLCDVVRFGLPETQSSSEGTAPTRQQNGQVMLDKLSQSNLFIIPLDDERQWYRYHHLFADLLRHRLTQTHPEQISDLHNRASKWLEKNGFIKQAIIHALNLDEKYRAADLIERYSKNFFYQGVAQIDELLAWFNLLPDKLIQERPLIHIFLARALAFKSPFQNKDTINRILDQTQLLLNNKDWGKTIEDLVAGHIASLRGLMSSPPIQPDHDPDMVLALFQEALRLLPPDEARLRSGIYNVIAYEYMHLGDIEPALRASQTANSEARKVNNNISAIIALRNQAVIAYHQGELAQAIDICQNGLISFSQNSTGKVPLIPGLEALFTALGYMYVECGELEKAEIELKTGFDMLRLANEYEAVLIGHVALIRMLLMKNGTEQARQICKQLKTEWPGFVKLAETLQVQVELSYIESNTITLEKITGWLIENRFIIEASVDIQGITPWAETQHISVLTWIKGQITLSRHNPESHNYHSLQMCLDYLEKQCHSSEEHGLVFRVIECNVYKTIVLEALGENFQAMACLEQALKLAEPRGYVRVFVETGKPIERLLREASDHGISPIYVQKLLTAFEIKYQPDLIASPIDAGDLRTIDFNSQTASPLMEPLTDRELEVLHLMAKGLTYNEIAGQIMVSLNTVRTHVKNIYSKLFVHKRSQAIAKAKELNIL